MKGFFIFLLLIVAGMWWASKNVTEPNVLKYAKDKNSDSLSPKLEYYTGVYAYSTSDWAGTEAAFMQLLTDYPTGYYAPEATIKLGDALYHEGRRQDSLAQYQHYLEQWPDGELATIAKKNVENLGNP
jgi:TolA-binding protein